MYRRKYASTKMQQMHETKKIGVRKQKRFRVTGCQLFYFFLNYDYEYSSSNIRE